MDHFRYNDGRLFCESVDLADVAANAGTPVYVYSAATIRLHVERLTAAFRDLNPTICFSVKSCSNLAILKLIVGMGCGLDVVSGGELHRARIAGVDPAKVVYAGVGKTDEEIIDALGRGPAPDPALAGAQRERIGLFNIESETEFQNIASITRSLNTSAEACLRINPDVDPKTHVYTTTGKKENKFGVDLDRARAFFRRFGTDKHLRLTGLHLHIGSPVYDTEPYVQALTKALGLIDELAKEGFRVTTLNLGGGFAADYQTGLAPPASEYAAAIVPLLRERVAKGELKIIFEPGRTIAANAGVLLTRVLYTKESGPKKFIVCDAGMHTLIRPSLYGSFHFIWPAAVADQHVPTRREEHPHLPGLEVCDVVGPICESGDFLAKDRELPMVARGDLLTVFGAGAYGMSMASRYNSHALPAEVLIDGSRATVIRKRETYADLVSHELANEDLAL